MKPHNSGTSHGGLERRRERNAEKPRALRYGRRRAVERIDYHFSDMHEAANMRKEWMDQLEGKKDNRETCIEVIEDCEMF
jgi:hypothetical protein